MNDLSEFKRKKKLSNNFSIAIIFLSDNNTAIENVQQQEVPYMSADLDMITGHSFCHHLLTKYMYHILFMRINFLQL